ncbi:helix-turn-helix domain-containing protein [Flavobacterium soyangense]|nr:helix-turn-helix domain-containing protein [Flavobacterium soyangense]
MPYYTPTEEMLEKIHSRISELALNVKTKQHLEPEDVFFDSQEFMLLMNISKRTAQQWRDNKVIGFSQIGNKIYYRLCDIQELLKENYNIKKEQ